MKITGLIPATATPFLPNGQIDHEDLKLHIERTGAATGLYGIAVNGHAGEIATLTSDERFSVVETARRAIPDGLKLVAGIEGRSIDELVREGIRAKQAGADMLLVLPIFDIRPFRHLAKMPEIVLHKFRRLNDEVGLPMIIFHYSEASGCAYSVAALSAVSELEHVVGIKAAVESTAQFAELHDALKDRLSVLAASDSPSLLGMLLHGSPGALISISVIGTQHWSDLVRESVSGSADKARSIHNTFARPLMDAVFEDQMRRSSISPFGATKEALVQLGQMKSSWMRPPSVNVNDAKKRAIRNALVQSGLLRA
ncbi:MAG: dihydrodipicolinate synthase family protein [Lautropia sp.]